MLKLTSLNGDWSQYHLSAVMAPSADWHHSPTGAEETRLQARPFTWSDHEQVIWG